MIVSSDLQFKPNECEFQYEDNCFDCIHFVCLNDNNSIECNYTGNEDNDEVEE